MNGTVACSLSPLPSIAKQPRLWSRVHGIPAPVGCSLSSLLCPSISWPCPSLCPNPPRPAGAVRASSIFPILSVILLFMGGLCIAASEFYKTRHNIILSAGIFFVSAGNDPEPGGPGPRPPSREKAEVWVPSGWEGLEERGGVQGEESPGLASDRVAEKAGCAGASAP